MKELLQYSHPLCFSVAYCEARLFIYQAFKVKEDKQFIIDLISKNDKENLDFMEEFYKTVLKEGRTCENDVYSRNTFHMLPLTAIGDLGYNPNEEIKEFKKLKNKMAQK